MLTSDRTQTYWREGSLGSFLWTIVIGVVGAIITLYISSKISSTKKQNSTWDDKTPQANGKKARGWTGRIVVMHQEEALRRTVEWQWANPLEKYDPKEFDYATKDTILAELEQTDKH